MDRTKAIEYLTTNCSCWKGQEKVLNGMQDAQLEQLVSDSTVANAARTGFAIGDNEYRITANGSLQYRPLTNAKKAAAKNAKAKNEREGGRGADDPDEYDAMMARLRESGEMTYENKKGTKNGEMPAFIKEKIAKREDEEDVENADDMEEEEEEYEDMPKNKKSAKNKKTTSNGTPTMNREQMYALMTPGDREALAAARKIVAKEKVNLIRQITANVADEEARIKHAQRLAGEQYTVENLREMLELIPTNNRSQEQTVSDMVLSYFTGQAGGPPIANSGEDDAADDILPLTVENAAV